MHCPACDGSLSIVDLYGCNVGICPLCEGIWFDSADLKTVVDKMIAAGEVNPPETTTILEPRKVERSRQQELRMCPDCGLVMKNLNYAADSNVFIDKCGQCGGVWTDIGDLMAIAEYIKGDPRVAEIGNAIIKSDKKTGRTAAILRWAGELIDLFFWL
ncbi:MAG: zf-TFIIB domain-containing protein [Phycisphaerae bacterium]|nr:zf-TFIIB domain-containing protein [Phycisphaerae bacterium]